MQNLLDSLLSGVPDILAAVVFLIIALIVSGVVKKVIITGGKKIGLDKLFQKFGLENSVDQGELLQLVGKIAYIIVFILFLPGILERLNISGVSAPLIAMSTSFFNYLPNILAAIIIFAVGMFISKIVKQILISLLSKINLGKLKEKAGINAEESAIKFSNLIANVVYAIILVTVTIAALEVLNIKAITEPAVAMLSTILNMVPNILASIVLFVIGYYIAKFTSSILFDLLNSVGINSYAGNIFEGDNKSKVEKVDLSKIISEFVKYIIILIFTVEAVNVINLEVLQNIGVAVIAFLPTLISSIIILAAGFYLSKWISGFVSKLMPDATVIPFIVKSAILVLTVFMTLNQLGVASFIVNTAFILVLGSLAVAAAIAFGIGGKDFAAKLLDRIDFDKKDKGNKEN